MRMEVPVIGIESHMRLGSAVEHLSQLLRPEQDDDHSNPWSMLAPSESLERRRALIAQEPGWAHGAGPDSATIPSLYRPLSGGMAYEELPDERETIPGGSGWISVPSARAAGARPLARVGDLREEPAEAGPGRRIRLLRGASHRQQRAACGARGHAGGERCLSPLPDHARLSRDP